MGNRNHVVSFSGGKDSTALLLEMLERGEKIHSVVAFDTGWEFPQMLEHWDAVEEYTGIEIVRVAPKESFDYWMFDRPVVGRKGENKGVIRQYGNGWPSSMRRWCTREKVYALERHFKNIDDLVLNIGYAADEAHRLERGTLADKPYKTRYPLIEWGIDEVKALAICKAHGFDWGGLYDHFRRVSCFCCPLQPLPELRTLYHSYPELWSQMREWDKRCNGNNPGFYGYKTVQEMEDRFREEDKLGDLFNIRKYNKKLIDPQLLLFSEQRIGDS